VPDRVLGKPSQKEGPLAGVTIDEDTLVKEYLRVLDWDLVTTRPSSKRLTELGLTDIAKLVKV
jgi:aldehyde:ferredoxin oxidoreductase